MLVHTVLTLCFWETEFKQTTCHFLSFNALYFSKSTKAMQVNSVLFSNICLSIYVADVSKICACDIRYVHLPLFCLLVVQSSFRKC
jgi:hypothetical protein